VISANQPDLAQRVAQKQFREDLYYRLCVVPIRVPPLRERASDVRPLAEYFLEESAAATTSNPNVWMASVAALEKFGWPGNARELKNVIERMAILTPGERLGMDAVPLEIRLPEENGARSSVQDARDAGEREHICGSGRERLERLGGGRVLGLERTNLHKRIRALGIRASRASGQRGAGVG